MDPEKRTARVCPGCGTQFRILTCRDDEWGYWVGGRACCSYKCMRETERARLHKKHARERSTKVCRMFEDLQAGMTYTEIADKYRSTPKEVYSRMWLWETMHPELAEMIRDDARRARLAE